MASRALNTKMAEIHAQAVKAINERLKDTHYDLSRSVLNMWAEPDGVVVLHLNSSGNAIAVTHALWNRYKIDTDVHPEHGVLLLVS